MFNNQRTNLRPETRLGQIASDGRHLLSSLLEPTAIPANMVLWLDRLDELVDCMMLGTSDYGLAKLRINNAQRFVQAGELGAAKFEIRHLGAGIKDQLRPARIRRVDLPSVEIRPTQENSETSNSDYAVN